MIYMMYAKIWSLPLTFLLSFHIHPLLFIVWLIAAIHVFKDDRSCDSDDGNGPGGRGRSGSYMSQISRADNEESSEDQYSDKSHEAQSESDSQEQVVALNL